MTARLRTLLFALLVAPSLAVAAAEDDDLRRLLGKDVGAYVQLPGLESTVREVWKGTLAERIRGLSLYEKWLSSDDHARLQSARDGLTKAIGRPVETFAADLLGRDVLLAVTPVADGEPEAILLTTTADEKALRDAVTTWNRLDPKQITTKLEHAGHAYFRRAKEKETVFYAFEGTTLALSEQEARIHDLLERWNDDDGGLLDDPAHRRAVADLPADASAVVYVAPRAWDGTLPEPKDEPVARAVAESWQRAESIVATLRTGNGGVLDVTIRYDDGAGNTGPRIVVPAGENDHSKFLDRVPSRVLLVAWGRFDLAGIGDDLYSTLSPGDRRKIEPWRRFVARRMLGGLDLLDDVLPVLGPECGIYVVPRDRIEPGAVPFDGLLAIGLAPSETDSDESKVAKTQKELDELIVTALDFLVAAHNGKSDENEAALESAERNGVRTHWVTGMGSHRPAYAATPEFLVLASDPALIDEFTDPVSPKRLLDQAWFSSLRDRYFPRHDHLVLFDLAAARRFLETHESELVDEITRSRGADRDRVAAGAARLREFLGLAEATYFAGHVGPSEVRLVIGALAEPRE